MTDTLQPQAATPAAALDAKYRDDDGTFFFTGVQALVRLPLDQMRADRGKGLHTATFVSGYQGSPLGGFDRELIANRELLDSFDVVHRPGVNEELGATAVMGSQLSSTFPSPRYDGVLGIWYGKAPGLDRASDAIRHANYAGTSAHGGVLALTGDDPANKSSTLPSASEHTLADLHLPTLFPGNVQEVLDLGRHGIALSRAAGLWTGLKIVTAVADGSAAANVGVDRISPVIPEVEWAGKPYRPSVTGWVAGPMSNDVEQQIYEVRYEIARRYAIANRLNEITVNPGDAWLGIVASGHTYRLVLDALHVLGLDDSRLHQHGIRVLRMSMVHPFEPEIVRQFGDGLDEIVVVEEKRPFIETHVRDALYGRTNAPRVIGKHDDVGARLVPAHGALDADLLVEPLRRRLTKRIDASRLTAPDAPTPTSTPKQLIELLPSRTPYVCSGCPHSTSLQVPSGALVGAGIGCHGMAAMMPADRVGTVTGITQMGGEGAQWIGIEPFVETDHYVQNLGDGTFAHSGSLAIRAAVAAGVHMTYKILYNDAVAMTGGQDASGAMPVPSLVRWLNTEGVSEVIVTTDDLARYRGVRLPGAEVWHRDRIIEAQEQLATVPGVTALVHDQQCAAEKRRDRKRGLAADPPQRIVINERVCEGCGDCGVQSNCLSVQPVDTELGRKTQIHQSSCNKDYTCVKGDCPSFLTVTPRTSRRRRRAAGPTATRAGGGARRVPRFDVDELTEPTRIVPDDDTTVRMPGIGGTGVVTVSQVIGTAATLDGKYVSGLDQTGLSQKAGPVVSDLRITTTPLEVAGKATKGSADLYLVFDLLVALAPQNLGGVAAQRTVAVVSTSKTATGAMVRDASIAYPDIDGLRAQVDAATRADHNRYLDTTKVTDALFGDATTANMFQVGVAYQVGALPISASAIEQAIELNGAAIEANTWAFRWGRMWAVDPGRVRDASEFSDDDAPPPPPWLEALIDELGIADGEIGRLVRYRATDLVAYQNERCARRYVKIVGQAATTGHADFAEAVARNLYKLMAYKDEYEVARLHLESAAQRQVTKAIGDDVIVKWNLHPPLLRALGLKRKIQLGPWFTPAMRALQAGKRLRGTPLDPFGYAKVRRVERSLAKEYHDVVARLSKRFDGDNAAMAVELADLPDMIRGYEDIKLANVERYLAELARLRGTLGV